jgi:hypothetical protein
VEKHQIEEGRKEMLEQQIKAIIEEYRAIEKKSSQIEVYFLSFALLLISSFTMFLLFIGIKS